MTDNNIHSKQTTGIEQRNDVQSQRTVHFFVAAIIAIGALLLGIQIGRGNVTFFAGKDNGVNTNLASSPNYRELNELYSVLKRNYDGKWSETEIMNGLKHGLASSTGDPHTVYMTQDEAKEFMGDLQGTFSGIGAKIELDDEKNVIIAAPLVGSPAEAAGLRAKDVLVSINGESAYGLSVSEAVKKIRGEKGSEVALRILRNKTEVIDVKVTRDTIKVPSVVTKTLDGNIGYIQITQFSSDTDELAREAALKMATSGVKGIVLDLRDNPGGEVESAVNLSSLWLETGKPVVEERTAGKTTRVARSIGGSILKEMPTIVLQNAGSASASEITALALRDEGKAKIYGEKSYGKGSVQQPFNLSDNSSVKVTVGRWYSPKGTNVDKKGVVPDKEIKMTEEDYKNGTDPQLEAARQELAQ